MVLFHHNQHPPSKVEVDQHRGDKQGGAMFRTEGRAIVVLNQYTK